MPTPSLSQCPFRIYPFGWRWFKNNGVVVYVDVVVDVLRLLGMLYYLVVVVGCSKVMWVVDQHYYAKEAFISADSET